jgi:hypothetical protein
MDHALEAIFLMQSVCVAASISRPLLGGAMTVLSRPQC